MIRSSIGKLLSSVLGDAALVRSAAVRSALVRPVPVHSAVCLAALVLLGMLSGSPAHAHDGPHGFPGAIPVLPPDSLKTYEFSDTLEVQGRFDDLIGVAATASEGTVGREDFEVRPILREGELLETVPGLIQTQHSGDGKGNQMFLRGFNLDHGTDFATDVEGMPINLPTHGHGHGYTDVNFLIPELVERIDYRKGVFHPELGDFASSGGTHVVLRRSLPRSFFQFEGGKDRFRRAVGAASQHIGPGIGLVGFEFKGYDGPWDLEQDLKKSSGLARYTVGWGGGTLSLLALGYDNEWNATDQIPLRAVESGQIDRFGNIDPTLGGRSHRYSFLGTWHRAREGRSLELRAYAVDYSLRLYSNFTYYLKHPDDGDQLLQADDRVVVGAGATGKVPFRWRGRSHLLEAGVTSRNDFISKVALYHTKDRVRLDTVREDEVVELAGGAYASLTSRWHPRFRTQVGLRVDAFHFDVEDALIEENSGTQSAAIASPKASLIYGLSNHAEAYLSGGLGFHSNDARGTTIRVDPASGDPAESVDPLVRSKGGELGLRLSPTEGLRSSVALWYLALDSELLYVGDGGGTEASDGSERYGVEWNNVYRVLDELTVDLDVAFSHANFVDVAEGEDHVPGALENVVAGGVTWNDPTGLFATVRLRHLGAYALIEDDSVRADATTLINANVGFRFGSARISCALLNVLDDEARDIQYYYESRLPGEPEEGVSDVHFHPVEPRQLRVMIGVGL